MVDPTREGPGCFSKYPCGNHNCGGIRQTLSNILIDTDIFKCLSHESLVKQLFNDLTCIELFNIIRGELHIHPKSIVNV